MYHVIVVIKLMIYAVICAYCCKNDIDEKRMKIFLSINNVNNNNAFMDFIHKGLRIFIAEFNDSVSLSIHHIINIKPPILQSVITMITMLIMLIVISMIDIKEDINNNSSRNSNHTITNKTLKYKTHKS